MIRRWLFNILAVVSLLLCVATVAIWIDSYRTERTLAFTTFEPEGTTNWRWRNWQCYLGPNRTVFTFRSDLANDVRYERDWGYRPYEWYYVTSPAGTLGAIPAPLYQRLLVWGQVSHHRDQLVVSGTEYRASVRFWTWLALFAILPWMWMRKHWRGRRSYDECAACGYNLTGNTSGTCPECGSAVPAAALTPPAH